MKHIFLERQIYLFLRSFCKKNYFFQNRYKSTAFQVGYHSAFYHPSPDTSSRLPTLRFAQPSMQDKLRHLHPETHAVHITLSRINIANIKTRRMRFPLR